MLFCTPPLVFLRGGGVFFICLESSYSFWSFFVYLELITQTSKIFLFFGYIWQSIFTKWSQCNAHTKVINYFMNGKKCHWSCSIHVFFLMYSWKGLMDSCESSTQQWSEEHVWHRMKQLSNISPFVEQHLQYFCNY